MKMFLRWDAGPSAEVNKRVNYRVAVRKPGLLVRFRVCFGQSNFYVYFILLVIKTFINSLPLNQCTYTLTVHCLLTINMHVSNQCQLFRATVRLMVSSCLSLLLKWTALTALWEGLIYEGKYNFCYICTLSSNHQHACLKSMSTVQSHCQTDGKLMFVAALKMNSFDCIMGRAHLRGEV